MLSKRNLLKATGALAGTTLAAPFVRASTSPGFLAAKDIAELGYIYGLPIVMNYGVMHEYVLDKNSGQYKGPFNTIANEARVFTYEDTSVITPNSDTPYSLLWLDLRTEPMVISVPDVDPKRYYSVQLTDGNTYTYGYIGSRSTGNGAGHYMIAGPSWTGANPDGIARGFQSTTDFSIAIFRTQLFGPDDMENVKAVQAGYAVQPLSSFLKQAAPAAPAAVDFPAFSAELAKTNFFEFLDFSLQFAPALPNEVAVREQLAQIGVGPGKTFAFKDLPLEQKAEVLLGLEAGKKKVDAAALAMGTAVNNWHVASIFGDSGFFHGDWLRRAAGAQAGIYGNNAEEAMYPMTRADSTGAPIDTSKANYELTFPADGLPPVNAFWSVTMYDGKTQLLIKNPINRYLINSPMLPQLKKNGDGSLTLYIQNKQPGGDKDANWLPAPDGTAYLVMRLYWPKIEQPSILPPGSGQWKPPAVMKVS